MSLLEDILVTFLESHFLFFYILDIVGAYVSVPFIFLDFGQSGCICECTFYFFGFWTKWVHM